MSSLELAPHADDLGLSVYRIGDRYSRVGSADHHRPGRRRLDVPGPPTHSAGVRSSSAPSGIAVAAVASGVALAACAGPAPGRAGPPSCGETDGRTVEVDLDISIRGQTDRHALVHLPPCYDDETGEYPSVYLLHGAGMDPDTWTSPSIRLDDIADRLFTAGGVDPMVVVMPPRSTWSSGFPEEILDPLIAEVDARFRTIDDAGARGIGGFSAGGSATLQSAFTGDPRVAAVGLYAIVFVDSVGDEMVAGMEGRPDRPVVHMEAGDRDRLQRQFPAITEALEAIDVTPTEELVPGGHDFAYVADRAGDWLTWFADELAPND